MKALRDSGLAVKKGQGKEVVLECQVGFNRTCQKCTVSSHVSLGLLYRHLQHAVDERVPLLCTRRDCGDVVGRLKGSPREATLSADQNTVPDRAVRTRECARRAGLHSPFHSRQHGILTCGSSGWRDDVLPTEPVGGGKVSSGPLPPVQEQARAGAHALQSMLTVSSQTFLA